MDYNKLTLLIQDNIIASIILPKPFGKSVHYYIPQKLKDVFANKPMLVLEKDGKKIVIIELD